jgi:hypothetical protein
MFDDITGTGSKSGNGGATKIPASSGQAAKASMTSRELEVWKAALHWLKRYDDSNPDVGMGPSMRSLLSDLEQQTGITLTDDERKKVLA